MKELPKYGFLTSGVGFEGIKVIMLERPYLIASIYEVSTNDTERVEQMMEDMVQERYPIAKVKGYSIFLKMYSSLEPCGNPEFQQNILNEMADFVLTERVQKKLGQFRKYDETDRSSRFHHSPVGEERKFRPRRK